MDSPWFLLVVLPYVFFSSGVDGHRMLYGAGVSACDKRIDDLRAQVCPKGSSESGTFVRLKTYNGKYVFAEPKDANHASYARTRCCGVKDVLGRKDVKVPGRRTTFHVRCKTIGVELTVGFEVLKKESNEPSGYYLYAHPSSYDYLYVVNNPNAADGNANFVLQRWQAGPQIGIKSLSRDTWLSFKEDNDGYIDVKKKQVSNNPFPYVGDRFTIEIVPKECLEVPDGSKIKAAPQGTSPDDCERLPDRCYWTDGWDYRRSEMKAGHCYYKKGSMCYQPNAGARTSCAQQGSKDCEAANCCYDYQRNTCYKGKAI